MSRILVAALIWISAVTGANAVDYYAPKYYAPYYSAVINGRCRAGYIYYRYNCAVCPVPTGSLRVVGNQLYCVVCPPSTYFDGQRYCVR